VKRKDSETKGLRRSILDPVAAIYRLHRGGQNIGLSD
jgi:hypothetical protein